MYSSRVENEDRVSVAFWRLSSIKVLVQKCSAVRWRLSLAFLAVFLVAAALNTVRAQPNVPTNQWTKVTELADPDAVDDYGNCKGLPCRRAWFPMVYHKATKRSIIVGGSVAGGCGGGYVNDVWELWYDAAKDGWQWNQRKPVNRTTGIWPQGMDNHVMAYDAINQYMWILGGTCGGGFGYYDYASNKFVEVGKYNVSDTNEPYDSVYDPGFAWGGGELVVFSGEPAWEGNPGGMTSAFDTTQKTPAGWSLLVDCKNNPTNCSIAPKGRQQIEEVMVYIPTTDRFLIFGGQLPITQYGQSTNDTWEFDRKNRTWIKIDTSGGWTPPARDSHIMVYDSKNDVVIMHGGTGGRKDTWMYHPHDKTWTLINSNGPQLRLHGAVYDEINDVVLIWSGLDETRTKGNMFVFRLDSATVSSSPSADLLNIPKAPTEVLVQ